MIMVASGPRSLVVGAGSTAAGHPISGSARRAGQLSHSGPLPTAAGATPNDDPAFSSRNAAREATPMHNIHRVTSGIAVDPVRQIAIANPIAISFVSKLIPRGLDNPEAPNATHPSGNEIGVHP